ncbi:hypothetical protein SUGI_0363810 [Cryptomeria japonica]|nr:hypothetical protein SUGI_0363810 [Cryptomeria japonica]
MATLEGSRSSASEKRRVTDVQYSGAQSMKVKDNFESWCREQWGTDININILPNDFYMIEFMSNEEKWKAKNKGPYMLDGIEVHIIDWQPNFNP